MELKYQNITFKEFKFLTENGMEKFVCRHTTIKYCNGTIVPIEVIFANLKNVKNVFYTFEKDTAKLVTAETANELTKIIDTSKLKKFHLEYIPSIFDFLAFKKFTDAHDKIDFVIKFD